MEGLFHVSESGWTINDSFDIWWGEDKVLNLSWENTKWFRHMVGSGEYDFVEHKTADGEIYQFFSDDPNITRMLIKNNYPFEMLPYVEQDLIDAKQEQKLNNIIGSFVVELSEDRYLDELDGS